MVRGFIQELLEQELTAALGRTRHERAEGEPKGYRNGTRERQLLGSFGPVELSVPRARMATEGGGTQEWRSATLPRYARMTRQVEALIAGAYLSGTNTRRVKRAGCPVWQCCGQGRRADRFAISLGQPHRHRFAVLPSWGSLRDGARSRRTGTPGPSATWPGRISSA
jgi:Transposase, Mutator family